jgi:hypothetical protein
VCLWVRVASSTVLRDGNFGLRISGLNIEADGWVARVCADCGKVLLELCQGGALDDVLLGEPSSLLDMKLCSPLTLCVQSSSRVWRNGRSAASLAR